MNKPNRLNPARHPLLFCLLSCLLELLLPVTCLAAQANSSAPADEVIITENMDLHQLQAKTLEAERKVYKIFNALNDDDTYDVKCVSEKPTGSLMAVTTCRPNYVGKLMRLYHVDDLTASFREGGDALDRKDTVVPSQELRAYNEKYQELMSKLAADHEDLAAAIKVHAELARQLARRKTP